MKALHIHETARCDPGSGFVGRRALCAATGASRLRADKAPRRRPAQRYVHRDGTLRSHVLNTPETLPPGEASLLDADGSALVRTRGPTTTAVSPPAKRATGSPARSSLPGGAADDGSSGS
jgi:hypothetical protein